MVVESNGFLPWARILLYHHEPHAPSPSETLCAEIFTFMENPPTMSTTPESGTVATTRAQRTWFAPRHALLLVLALLPSAAAGCKDTSGDKIKVGILHSLTGTMPISENSLKDVNLMPIAAINPSAAVLGT